MPANANQFTSPYRIAMVLMPGFNALAVQSFLDPLRALNYLQDHKHFLWSFVSLDESIDDSGMTASNGMQVTGLQALEEDASQYDLVVINASWGAERFDDASLYGWLRQQQRFGAWLGATDTGAFILARAGFLDDVPVALHFEHHAGFHELFSHIQAVHQPYHIERGRLTAGGGMAPAAMALAFLALCFTSEVIDAVANYIYFPCPRDQDIAPLFEKLMIRPGQDAVVELQKGNINKVNTAITLMKQTLEDPLSIVDIAQRVGLSSRQLARQFHHQLGIGPKRCYLNLRLQRAHQLVTQTALVMAEIAVATGFTSGVSFSRAYTARFDISPSQDRRRGHIPYEWR